MLNLINVKSKYIFELDPRKYFAYKITNTIFLFEYNDFSTLTSSTPSRPFFVICGIWDISFMCMIIVCVCVFNFNRSWFFVWLVLVAR